MENMKVRISLSLLGVVAVATVAVSTDDLAWTAYYQKQVLQHIATERPVAEIEAVKRAAAAHGVDAALLEAPGLQESVARRAAEQISGAKTEAMRERLLGDTLALGIPMESVLSNLDPGFSRGAGRQAAQMELARRLLSTDGASSEASRELRNVVVAPEVRVFLEGLACDATLPDAVRAEAVRSLAGSLPGSGSDRRLHDLALDDATPPAVRVAALTVLQDHPSWAGPSDVRDYLQLVDRSSGSIRSLAMTAADAASRLQEASGGAMVEYVLSAKAGSDLREAIQRLGVATPAQAAPLLAKLEEIALSDGYDVPTRIVALQAIGPRAGRDRFLSLNAQILRSEAPEDLAIRLLHLLSLNGSYWDNEPIVQAVTRLSPREGKVGEVALATVHAFEVARRTSEEYEAHAAAYRARSKPTRGDRP